MRVGSLREGWRPPVGCAGSGATHWDSGSCLSSPCPGAVQLSLSPVCLWRLWSGHPFTEAQVLESGSLRAKRLHAQVLSSTAPVPTSR